MHIIVLEKCYCYIIHLTYVCLECNSVYHVDVQILGICVELIITITTPKAENEKKG